MRGHTEYSLEMSVQMRKIHEPAVGDSGVDIFVFFKGLTGMLDLAIQEKLIG